jgi:hypothetical protein
MAKEQQVLRRKLLPKRQISGRIQRRRISPPLSYGREEILTANQQAWACAFTTSLSGWRSRQKFYKDHLEAEIQAEHEAIATGAAYDAERLAQRKVDEQEEAERKANELAEEEEEKAEAWTHKAWEMHKAGRGVRKLKHEYYGWDPEEEEYPRDLKTERILARAKAKRMAERRAELLEASENPDDAYDTDKDSDLDNSETEGSAVSGEVDFSSESSRSPSGSPSRSPHPAPVIERALVVDWREKARAGVIKKKLSVAKAWGAITWNQKSNIQERLLVLEDDGYDISDLLNGKASSEDVTNIILARAAGEQSPAPRAAQPLVQLLVQPGTSQELPPDWLDPALLDELLGPVSEESPPGSPSASPPGSPSGSLPHSPASSGQQSYAEPEDHTQPFSFEESYYPQPSRYLKRKRNDKDDADIEDELALSSPVQKKRKVQWVADDELAAQALQEMKRKVLRGVFRSARIIGRKPLPSSQVVFTAETSVDAREQIPQQSSLCYLYRKTSRSAVIELSDTANSKSPQSAPGDPRTSKLVTSRSISKCGLHHILAELRFLTNTVEEQSMIQINDTDYDEDLVYTPTNPEERIKQNMRIMQRQASCITLTVDLEGLVTFQGDAIVLAKLFKALRTRELLHHAVWGWDELRLRRSSDLSWYLSPQTQDTFVEIESGLERGPKTGGFEIFVGVKDNP